MFSSIMFISLHQHQQAHPSPQSQVDQKNKNKSHTCPVVGANCLFGRFDLGLGSPRPPSCPDPGSDGAGGLAPARPVPHRPAGPLGGRQSSGKSKRKLEKRPISGGWGRMRAPGAAAPGPSGARPVPNDGRRIGLSIDTSFATIGPRGAARRPFKVGPGEKARTGRLWQKAH